MAQAKGSRSRIIIQKETTYGIAPAAAAATLVYYSSCSLAMKRAQEQDDTLRGNRNPTRAMRGTTDVAGDLVSNLQAYSGLLFLGLLGAVATSGTGPFTHVFTVGDSMPSFLVEKGFVDIGQYFRYLGVKIGSMKLSISPAGKQAMTFSLLGAKELTATESFDANAVDLGYLPFDGFAVGAVKEGGVTIGNVTGIELSIDNGLDGDQYLLGGAGVRADIPEGTVAVSGKVMVRFTDLALYTKAVNDAESSLEVTFVRGTGDGSAGNEAINFLIPELTFTPQAPPVSGPRGIIAELPFVGFYGDGAEGSVLQITLKNTTETIG